MYVLIYLLVFGENKAVATATAEFSSKDACVAAGKSLLALIQPIGEKPSEVEGWTISGTRYGAPVVKWRCFPK